MQAPKIRLGPKYYFYAIVCCVFRPAFGCSKSWSKHFFQPLFNLFCSFQSFFSDFTAEFNQKRKKMNKKNVVLSTPQSWSTFKSWSTPWRGTPKLSFFGWFFNKNCDSFHTVNSLAQSYVSLLYWNIFWPIMMSLQKALIHPNIFQFTKMSKKEK